jgi:predicted phage-related endonuclease
LKPELGAGQQEDRRRFVGGSDARIIMGVNEAALIRLWREKRGEVEPEDLSGNLVVQLGNATERLNREWFQTATGQQVIDIQTHIRQPDRSHASARGNSESTDCQSATGITCLR